MKTMLSTLLLFLAFQNLYSQNIDTNHPAIAKLQKKYNEAIKIAMTTEKLPWNSAVIIADAAVNHTMDVDFNNAERYLRSVDQSASMMKIDSTIQVTIIFKGFASSPDLANVSIHDHATIIKALQKGRRKTPFPMIGLGSIRFGSTIQLAQHVIHNQVDGLDVFFDRHSTFQAVKSHLSTLAAALSKSGAKFQYFPGRGSDSDKFFCTFFNDSGDLAQLKLTFDMKDYFGKILNVEVVEKGEFKKEELDPPPIEKLN